MPRKSAKAVAGGDTKTKALAADAASGSPSASVATKAADGSAGAAGVATPAGESPATYIADKTKAEFAPPPALEKREATIDMPTAKSRIITLAVNLLVIAALWGVIPSRASTTATMILTPMFLLPVLDLLIAFVHMTMDNPALLSHPVLGAMAFDFQEHHVEPWKCAVWPAWYQATETVRGSLFYALYAVPLQWWWGMSMVPFALWTVVFGLLNQYTHRFCHMSPPQRPAFMKFLASAGIVNKPETHALHHQTLDQAYAILNGMANPIVTFLTTRWRHALHPNWPWYTIAYGITVPWLYGFFVLRASA